MFIFLVDANPMLTAWLTLQATRRGERFYHMDKLHEAPFFVQDLRPDVLVIEADTAKASDEEAFVKAIQEHPFIMQLPCIVLGERLPSWALGLSIKGHIAKPIDPSEFPSQVAKLLS